MGYLLGFLNLLKTHQNALRLASDPAVEKLQIEQLLFPD
jgi:hypothetical protein